MFRIQRIMIVSSLLLGTFGAGLAVRAGLQDVATTPSQSAGVATDTRVIQSGSCVLRVSADGAQLNGFSVEIGVVAAAPTVAGRHFSLDRVILGTNVGSYSADDAVLAFGGQSGHWGTFSLQAGEKVTPVVSDSVVACCTAKAVIAFGSRSIDWAVLPIPAGATVSGLSPEPPTVTQQTAAVTIDGRLYVFSNYTGKWSDPMP